MVTGQGPANAIGSRPGHRPHVARGLREPRGHREGRTRPALAARERPWSVPVLARRRGVVRTPRTHSRSHTQARRLGGHTPPPADASGARERKTGFSLFTLQTFQCEWVRQQTVSYFCH